MRVEIKALAKRLTKTANGALERAAKDAAESGHRQVTIDHVVLQILSVKDEDAERLLDAAGTSRADARKATLARLGALSSGAGGRPDFADSLWPWTEGAWLLASTELVQHRLRSGALLWAAARHADSLGHDAGPLAALKLLDAAAVRDALSSSPESHEALDLDDLEAKFSAAEAERKAQVRGEIEKARAEELAAAKKAAADAEAKVAAAEAAKAEAEAKAAAAEAAQRAWSAAEAAAAAKAKAEAAAKSAAGEGAEADAGAAEDPGGDGDEPSLSDATDEAGDSEARDESDDAGADEEE